MKKHKQLKKVLEKYFLELNSLENRISFANDVSEIMGFVFIDKTDVESVDKGKVILEGYNSKTFKTVTLIVEWINKI